MDLKIVLILLALFLIPALGYTGYTVLSDGTDEKLFNVVKVLDGDTLELESGQLVRLLGINSPEKEDYYYQEATEGLVELVEGKSVRLESGPEDVDRYGRLLRYVFIDGTFVNLQLVRSGYASVYFLNPDEKYYLEFKQAENDAKNNKFGIWNTSPIDCISIAEFNFDARGNDNENLNDEYVILQNNCGASVDMDGWSLKDEGTNIYTFRDFVFNKGSRFTLYTGSGVDTVTKLYWNEKMAVWNNAGDSLFLRDSEGNLVLSHGYY